MPSHRRFNVVHPYTVGFSNRFQTIKDRLDLSPSQYNTAIFMWHLALAGLEIASVVVFWYVDGVELQWGQINSMKTSWGDYDITVSSFYAQCSISLCLLLAFVATLVTTVSLRQVLFSVQCVVELSTTVPVLCVWIASRVEIDNRKIYVPFFLRVWPLLNHLTVCIEHQAPKYLQAPLIEIMRLVAAMFTSAGLFHLSENILDSSAVVAATNVTNGTGATVTTTAAPTCIGSNLRTTKQGGLSALTVSFFASLYFTVVTFGTIGYGDVEPTNAFSRFFVALIIIYALYRFPSFFNRMGELAEAHDRTLEYEGHLKGHVHVVISGNLDTELIAYVLDMFCRGGHLVRDVDGKKFRLVLLSPNEFSQHTQLLVNGPAFDGRVTLLRGSPSSLTDLSRARVSDALAHFYVCSPNYASDESDTATVMHTRKHVLAAPGVPQFLTIRRSENATVIKTRLTVEGNITISTTTNANTTSSHSSSSQHQHQLISNHHHDLQQQHRATLLERDKVLYAMIGAAVVTPGAIPLFMSLASSATKQLHGKTLHPWCDQYEFSLESETMRCEVPLTLIGKSFWQISDIFAEFDVTCLGFEIEEEIVDQDEVFGSNAFLEKFENQRTSPSFSVSKPSPTKNVNKKKKHKHKQKPLNASNAVLNDTHNISNNNNDHHDEGEFGSFFDSSSSSSSSSDDDDDDDNKKSPNDDKHNEQQQQQDHNKIAPTTSHSKFQRAVGNAIHHTAPPPPSNAASAFTSAFTRRKNVVDSSSSLPPNASNQHQTQPSSSQQQPQTRRRLLLNPTGKSSFATTSTRLIVVAISGAAVVGAVEQIETNLEGVLKATQLAATAAGSRTTVGPSSPLSSVAVLPTSTAASVLTRSSKGGMHGGIPQINTEGLDKTQKVAVNAFLEIMAGRNRLSDTRSQLYRSVARDLTSKSTSPAGTRLRNAAAVASSNLQQGGGKNRNNSREDIIESLSPSYRRDSSSSPQQTASASSPARPPLSQPPSNINNSNKTDFHTTTTTNHLPGFTLFNPKESRTKSSYVLNEHVLLLDLYSACKTDRTISQHRRADAEKARARKLFSLIRTVMLANPKTPVVLLARGGVHFVFSELWAGTNFSNPYLVDGCALDGQILRLCRPEDAKGVAIFSTHDGKIDEDFDTMAMLVSRSVDLLRRKKANEVANQKLRETAAALTAAAAEAKKQQQDDLLQQQNQQNQSNLTSRRSSTVVSSSLAGAIASGGSDASMLAAATYTGNAALKEQQTRDNEVPKVTTIIAFTQSESIALLPPFAKPRSLLDEMAQVSTHYVPSFLAGRVVTPQMVESLLFFSFFSTGLLEVAQSMLSIDRDHTAFGLMPIPPNCRNWREVRNAVRTESGYHPIALYRLVRAIQSEEESVAMEQRMMEAGLASGTTTTSGGVSGGDNNDNDDGTTNNNINMTTFGGSNNTGSSGNNPNASGGSGSNTNNNMNPNLWDEEEDGREDNDNVSSFMQAAKRSYMYRARLARQHGQQVAGDQERAARSNLRFVYLNPTLGCELVTSDLVFYLY